MGKVPKSIDPVTPQSGKQHRYQVSPQERWQAACKRAGGKPTRPGQVVFGCKDEEKKGLVTLNRTLGVYVQELLYPGDRSVAIVDKWIYVIQSGKYIAEIHAIKAAEWQILMNPDHKQPNDQRLLKLSASHVELDPGPQGNPHKYSFFLSPIRLTPKGLDYLLKAVSQSPEIAVTDSFQLITGFVEVPDPFHWAADASRLYYLPYLESWKSWTLDAERQSKLFIASWLKGIIDAGNKVGVKNELVEGQPDAWINQYKKEEQARRSKAEEAGAYLAHLIDSKDFFAVEISGMEAGGQSLSIVYQAWASVAPSILQSRPGQALAMCIVGDNERFPMKYIFTDLMSPANQLKFPQYRYAWLSAEGIFSELLPAVVKKMLGPAPNSRRKSIGIPKEH